MSDYFTIDIKMLKKRKIFPFQLHIYNQGNKEYSAFLNANAPLIKEKRDFLDYIFKRGGKLSVLYKQKMTFLNCLGLTEADVPSLRAKEDHPLEKVQKMQESLLKEKDEKEGPFIFKDVFKEAVKGDSYLPLIRRTQEEIVAFKVTISHTVSLARFFAEELLNKDNFINRIVAMSYMMAKTLDITDAESLADIVCAAFLHHIGETQLELPLCRQAQEEMDSVTKKQYKKHPGLTQHLIRKSQVDLSHRSLNTILEHHERDDGSGYPNNKVGSHIEPLALILGAISHIFEYSQGKIVGVNTPIESIIRNLKDRTLTPGLEFQFGDTMNNNLIYLFNSEMKKAA